MKRPHFAGVAAAALAVIVTTVIAVISSDGDDSGRIVANAPIGASSTTAAGGASTTVDLVSTTAAEQGWASASSRLVTSIAGGRYDDAYSLFGPMVRAEMSIDQWRQRFASTRATFVQTDDGKNGHAALVLTTVDAQGAGLVVRQQRGDIRFGYHADARRWLIDEFDLHDTPYIAPAPKSAFVQGAFDVVSIDENAKTALVLLTCTAPADTSITVPSLITVVLADAHLRLTTTDPLATFAEWAAAARTYRHWRFNILPTELRPSTAHTTYVSLDPTNNLNTCP